MIWYIIADYGIVLNLKKIINLFWAPKIIHKGIGEPSQNIEVCLSLDFGQIKFS